MTSPLPPERFLHVSHRGFVIFCLYCAEYAHELMRSEQYRVDWSSPRAAAYEAALTAVGAWTEIRSATRAQTDTAGQAAADAFAAADCTILNAIDAGDETRGARAARSAALGMIVPLAMVRGMGDTETGLWVPAYREDFTPRDDPDLPWVRLEPSAPFMHAAAAVERLQHAMPAEARQSCLETLKECLQLLRSMSEPLRSDVDDLMPRRRPVE